MSHQPNNIFAGTQVVALVEVRGPGDSLVHPRGAVGVVTRTPAVAGEKFKKIEQDIRNSGEIKWKHAMHLLRLLLTGAATLREGRVSVLFSNDQLGSLIKSYPPIHSFVA